MYGEQIKEKTKQHIKDNLMKAKEQGSQSQKFANLSNVTQFGVAKERGMQGSVWLDEMCKLFKSVSFRIVEKETELAAELSGQ